MDRGVERMAGRLRTFLLVMTLVVARLGAEADPRLAVVEAARIGDLVVNVYQPRDAAGKEVGEASFAILRGGQPLWAMSGHRFELGDRLRQDRKGSHWLVPGAPLLGGEPCLVVEHWSGGAHCCYTLHVFSLGRYVDLVDSIALQHGGWHFDDLDGDGSAELVCHDWTFAYWRASFAASPAPRMILRKGGDGFGFLPAPSLMSAPAPADSHLAARAEHVQTHLRAAKQPIGNLDAVAADLWGTMLDLAYSGNAPLAVRHFDRCWPDEVPGKREFLADYRDMLSRSPYWPAIAGAAASGE